MLLLLMLRDHDFELSNNALHKALLVYIIDIRLLYIMLGAEGSEKLKLIKQNHRIFGQSTLFVERRYVPRLKLRVPCHKLLRLIDSDRFKITLRT